MRPLWNGTLTFGLVVIPVRLYAATEKKSVSFRLLHEECHTPVKYMKWCPSCEKELHQSEIVKAYEYQKGEHVIVTEEDMEAIPGPSAHVIEILDFVNLHDVGRGTTKSFFLEPREGAEKAYSLLLVHEIRRQGCIGSRCDGAKRFWRLSAPTKTSSSSSRPCFGQMR